MSYKSYRTQVEEHLSFLQAQEFEIDELKINVGFVRVSQSGRDQIRGELVYKTTYKGLDNGLTGLQTWFRGPKGISDRFLTYGLGPCDEEKIKIEAKVAYSDNFKQQEQQQYEMAARKAYGFWNYSSTEGRSEYLERKGVGYYGLRFRSDEKYGDVAIVPMVDEQGRIWSYQILNGNGTKRQPKETRSEGLLHMIGKAIDGLAIGMAESYVSAASCFELTDIPTACVFGCHNLEAIGKSLKQRYPNSLLVIFADNDNHLALRGAKNQGLDKAKKTIQALCGYAIIVEPEFNNVGDSKEHSDWNDMVRLKGFDETKMQIQAKIRQQLIRSEIDSSSKN